ncbi:hypothetical protein EV368DRAFT_66284 [Lentinula lateritia]|nr:hypothetical protein EV368DRAFT_66284 [Lentinula lateritia]
MASQFRNRLQLVVDNASQEKKTTRVNRFYLHQRNSWSEMLHIMRLRTPKLDALMNYNNRWDMVAHKPSGALRVRMTTPDLYGRLVVIQIKYIHHPSLHDRAIRSDHIDTQKILTVESEDNQAIHSGLQPTGYHRTRLAVFRLYGRGPIEADNIPVPESHESQHKVARWVTRRARTFEEQASAVFDVLETKTDVLVSDRATGNELYKVERIPHHEKMIFHRAGDQSSEPLAVFQHHPIVPDTITFAGGKSMHLSHWMNVQVTALAATFEEKGQKYTWMKYDNGPFTLLAESNQKRIASFEGKRHVHTPSEGSSKAALPHIIMLPEAEEIKDAVVISALILEHDKHWTRNNDESIFIYNIL